MKTPDEIAKAAGDWIWCAAHWMKAGALLRTVPLKDDQLLPLTKRLSAYIDAQCPDIDSRPLHRFTRSRWNGDIDPDLFERCRVELARLQCLCAADANAPISVARVRDALAGIPTRTVQRWGVIGKTKPKAELRRCLTRAADRGDKIHRGRVLDALEALDRGKFD